MIFPICFLHVLVLYTFVWEGNSRSRRSNTRWRGAKERRRRLTWRSLNDVFVPPSCAQPVQMDDEALSLFLSFISPETLKLASKKREKKKKKNWLDCVCAAGREGTADHHHATDYKISAQQPLILFLGRRTEYCGLVHNVLLHLDCICIPP